MADFSRYGIKSSGRRVSEFMSMLKSFMEVLVFSMPGLATGLTAFAALRLAYQSTLKLTSTGSGMKVGSHSVNPLSPKLDLYSPGIWHRISGLGHMLAMFGFLHICADGRCGVLSVRLPTVFR